MGSRDSLTSKLRSKDKVTKKTLIKSAIRQKRQSQASTYKIDQIRDLSRKDLIKALSAMGIVTPSSIKIDVLRCLYEANRDRSVTRNRTEEADTINHDGELNSGHQMTRHHHDDNDQDKIKSNQQFTKQDSGSGKTLTLFSAPVAQESASYYVVGVEGRRESDFEPVPKELRKAIVEGYNVNLVHLLLPQDNGEDHGNIIYLQPKADPRFDRHLTILEFILAFSRYMNIICEVFSQRRRELMAYMSDIICLSARFGHAFFYDYHRLFARKAEALLQTRHVSVDWSKRDHDTYFSVFSGLQPIVCNLCRSSDHFTHFCNKVLDRMFANTSVLAGDSSNASSLLLRPSGDEKDKQAFRSTCKFFNGAGFGICVRLNCRFDHLCSRCRGNHPEKACTQKPMNRFITTSSS